MSAPAVGADIFYRNQNRLVLFVDEAEIADAGSDDQIEPYAEADGDHFLNGNTNEHQQQPG